MLAYKKMSDDDQRELLWQRGHDKEYRTRKDRVGALRRTEGQRRFPTVGSTKAEMDKY